MMFRSIQQKIVLIYGLLILSITIVIGSFLLVNLTRFYDREFTVMMEQVFTDDFVGQLDQLAEGENGLEKLTDAVASYIGPLGIDTYRFYCVLDAKTGGVLKTSDPYRSQNLTKSDNIILAMTGKRGNLTDFNRDYMDYAVPVLNKKIPEYVVYVKDTKDEIYSITKNVALIILEALLLGILISIIIGFWLSRTISVPIINLTKRAEKVASGEFETMPLSKANDEIGRLTNTFQYMSAALKTTLEEVEAEKNKVETILQNMTEGILAFNLRGELIHINPEAKRALSYEDQEVLNFDSFARRLYAEISLGDLLYIRQEKPEERQVEMDGRFFRLTFATFRFENRIGGVLVVMHDITKQEKLEMSRREFVANVSHELRTPLTTVKSYAETLLDMSEENEMQQRFLKVIVSEADRMTRLVKDLLTLSRLDEKQGALKKEPIEMRSFVSDLVERMQINAGKKQQLLSYTAVNEAPVFFSDRDKLEQVVVNILSNAIKYTSPGGRIWVFSGRMYGEVYIKVADNGIGIPKENLSRIFERFYRVDKARSRDTGGTGLGLAIAKQIMDRLGGKITISSEYGKGTEVVLSLPV